MNHSGPFLALLLGLACLPTAVAQDKSATAAQFKSMDTNGDGKISRAEHAAGAKKMFEAMDASKDGKVIAAEMDAAHQKVTGKPPAKGEMSSAEKIKVVDTNGDGVLTAEEHAAGARAMFDRMDTNKDGFLSPAELEAGHARLLKK